MSCIRQKYSISTQPLIPKSFNFGFISLLFHYWWQNWQPDTNYMFAEDSHQGLNANLSHYDFSGTKYNAEAVADRNKEQAKVRLIWNCILSFALIYLYIFCRWTIERKWKTIVLSRSRSRNRKHYVNVTETKKKISTRSLTVNVTSIINFIHCVNTPMTLLVLPKEVFRHIISILKKTHAFSWNN